MLKQTAVGAQLAGEDIHVQHPLIQDLLDRPHKWRLWPAIAAFRWLLRYSGKEQDIKIAFRSKPSMSFAASEIFALDFGDKRLEIILSAPGFASIGSGLPYCDINRIVHDARGGGGINHWLDGFINRIMHILEESQRMHNVAFSLATNSDRTVSEVITSMAGRTAPLRAMAGGRLLQNLDGRGTGALGLVRAFVGITSKSGLEELFRAFTGFPAEVMEFTGGRVKNMEPVTIGHPLRRILGSHCEPSSAGCEIVLHGNSHPDACIWAQDPVRRASLALLAHSYIGSALPKCSIYLRLSVDNVPPAILGGSVALGGLAVLGKVEKPILIPLHEDE